MKPNRIILIRHGESMANLDYSLHATVPDHKVELSPKGHRQAEEAGQKIKAIVGDERVQFYVSPFKRTRQTLDGILKSFTGDNKIYESDDIREQEWGHFRDLAESQKIEAERDRFGTYFYRIPDGESGADVCTRVAVFLSTLHRDFEKPAFPSNVVIVTHGLTLRLFCKRWFHWTVDEYETLKNPKNCEIFILEQNKPRTSWDGLAMANSEQLKYSLITPFRKSTPPESV